MTLDRTMEAHALGVGSGLDVLYVRALRVSRGGASALEPDDIWHPMPGLDDGWLRGRRDRRRFPVGPGVFAVEGGPTRLLPASSTLVLDISAPEPPSKRGRLQYGELIAAGKVVARFRNAHWYYADLGQKGPVGLLTLAPASYLGPAEVGVPGVRERLSALAR